MFIRLISDACFDHNFNLFQPLINLPSPTLPIQLPLVHFNELPSAQNLLSYTCNINYFSEEHENKETSQNN